MVTSKAPAGNSNMPSTSTNSQTVSAPEVFRAEPLPKHTAGYADLEAAKPGTICSAAAYQWWQQAGMVLPALQGDVLGEACSQRTKPTIHQ